MIKYMLKQPIYLGDNIAMPGDIFEIKKLKHPVVLGGKNFKYVEVNTQHLMDKKFIKDNFTKGAYKSETPKRVLKTLMILFLYELSKYVTNEILIKLFANDDIDTPCDYDKDVK
ncbi:hypothetical protein ABFV69_06795 [Staphylococcus saprophyticus]